MVPALVVLLFVVLVFAAIAGILWFGNCAAQAFDELEDEPWH